MFITSQSKDGANIVLPQRIAMWILCIVYHAVRCVSQYTDAPVYRPGPSVYSLDVRYDHRLAMQQTTVLPHKPCQHASKYVFSNCEYKCLFCVLNCNFYTKLIYGVLEHAVVTRQPSCLVVVFQRTNAVCPV